jgi:hypothetical protein
MSRLGHRTPHCIARLAVAACACLPLASWAASDAPVTSPLGSGSSVLLEPAPPQADPRRQRSVFVCQLDGLPVFADRPCGAAAMPRELVVDMPRAGTPSRPGASVTTLPPAPRAATRPRAEQRHGNDPAIIASDSRCAALHRQLDEVNDRMRAGYSAREAARLWQRWRDLKDRLRTSRC